MWFEAKFPEFPLEEKCQQFYERSRNEAIPPTGITASFYLDLAEKIVRSTVDWVDESGNVIDPVYQDVWAHSSQRFASSVGPLIKNGRCLDLLDVCVKNIEKSVSDMRTGSGRAHDFWTRDIFLAIDCIRDRVPAARVERWLTDLSEYDPRDIYLDISAKFSPKDIHNWSVYSLTGEQMRRQMGAADELDFIDEHLKIQLQYRFTDMGMYVDPHGPMTYDLSVRQNLALLMKYGYDGVYQPQVEEILRRGAWTQLFYQSSTGEMPFGGRSNQFHHTEGMFCCVAEYMAQKYWEAGEEDIAGIFKRAARKSALSLQRWVLDAEPFRHIKNMFPQASLHGCDRYGYVTGYGLLASNLLALAALMSNDDIPEKAAPADLGGYVLATPTDFHRFWAAAGPLHVEIDLAAQLEFDATGLSRIHHRDFPSELGLSGGILSNPTYRSSIPPADRNYAIGPMWRNLDGEWRSLAETRPKQCLVNLVHETPELVEFEIEYAGESIVKEHYWITPQKVRITYQLAKKRIRVTVPLLKTDGQVHSLIQVEEHEISVTYRGGIFTAKCLDPECRVSRENKHYPNRNGVYDIGVFEVDSNELSIELTFEKKRRE